MLSNRFDKDEKCMIILIDSEKHLKTDNYQKSQRIRNREETPQKSASVKNTCV